MSTPDDRAASLSADDVRAALHDTAGIDRTVALQGASDPRTALESTVENLVANVQALGDRVDAITTLLDETVLRHNQLATETAKTAQAVAALTERVSKVEDVVNVLASDVQFLKTR
jgi:peptidoglycan hydrolase CwlO-like protein